MCYVYLLDILALALLQLPPPKLATKHPMIVFVLGPLHVASPPRHGAAASLHGSYFAAASSENRLRSGQTSSAAIATAGVGERCLARMWMAIQL